jgi:nucleotide-binding universal stress UspA family protein
MSRAELTALAERVMGLSGGDARTVANLDRTDDCWLWRGKLDDRGRGRVWRNGKLVLHHRAVWEILCGPIPSGALLCHHCDNPQCANPEHLYVGDSKTNVADMFNRGRHWTQREPERARQVGIANGRRNTWARGASNPKAKLTPAQVHEVAESLEGSRALARRLGVNRSTIQRIRSGSSWNALLALAEAEQ